MKKGKLLNRSEKFCSSDLFKQRVDLSLLSPLHVPYQEEGNFLIVVKFVQRNTKPKKDHKGNQKALYYQAYQCLENLPAKLLTP